MSFTRLHDICGSTAKAEALKEVLQLFPAKNMNAPMLDVNVKDPFGETPLHKAAKVGNDPICRVLLLNGADIDAVNNGGYTALHYASQYSHLAVLKTLVICGADKEASSLLLKKPFQVAGTNEARRYLNTGRFDSEDPEELAHAHNDMIRKTRDEMELLRVQEERRWKGHEMAMADIAEKLWTLEKATESLKQQTSGVVQTAQYEKSDLNPESDVSAVVRDLDHAADILQLKQNLHKKIALLIKEKHEKESNSQKFILSSVHNES